MYLEEDQSITQVKGEYKHIAMPTFGLTSFCSTGESNVRALYTHNNILYVVAGNKFGSIGSGGAFTQIGSNLSTSSGFAKIVSIFGGSDTNNQLVIIDGTNGYYYNVTSGVTQFPITDVDFPQTAVDITNQDDYVIYQKLDSVSFGLSNISDGATYQALDFASKFRQPDRLVSICSYKGELWLCGEQTTEVWVNSGNANFPFERRSDILIEMGNASRRSFLITATKAFWLAKSKSGGYGFVVADGYEPKVIATKAIMNKLDTLSTKSDCIGYAYAKGGHEFIDWVFPTDNVTLTYDITTDSWINRSSYVSSTYGRFLGNCHAFCYDKSLVGDFNSGIVYIQSNTTYTENSTAIKRQIVTPHVYQEGKRIFISRLQIDVQTNVGSNKTFTLELSTDRGNTWETVETFTVPTSGDGTLYTTSLGSSYCYTFRLTTTDDFNFTVLGFQAEAGISY
jgi:hypothetical protein